MASRKWIFAGFLGMACLSCKSVSQSDASVKDSGSGKSDSELPNQVYRFKPWIETIKKSLGTGNPNVSLDTAASNMVDGPTRIAAYNMQALGRLYIKQDEMFSKMRDDFKDMEDVIGEWDKWNTLTIGAKAANATPQIVANLENNKSKAMQGIRKLLKERDWYATKSGDSRIEKIERKVLNFDWQKNKKDRALILGDLQDELKAIDKTKYQFKSLETGDGLHELRRDLKWIVIELRVLNGMVVFNNTPGICSVDAYRNLVNLPISQSKYSQLPASGIEKNSCKVSQCLFLGLVQMVEDLGTIKDKAEARLNTKATNEEDDKVPDDLRADAEKLYGTMTKTDLMSAMRKELKACEDEI